MIKNMKKQFNKTKAQNLINVLIALTTTKSHFFITTSVSTNLVKTASKTIS